MYRERTGTGRAGEPSAAFRAGEQPLSVGERAGSAVCSGTS